jgi:hypothetical protein
VRHENFAVESGTTKQNSNFIISEMAANHPAKKMKIEEISDEKSITDPFVKVHEHVRELMLQQLTGREVLSLMEVSTSWNEIIAGSRKSMSKIKLKIEEKTLKNPSPEEVTALLDSDRPHQNMKLRIRNVANSGSMLLLLQRFSQSLVELDLKLGEQKKMVKNLPENMTFPKLKNVGTPVVPKGGLARFACCRLRCRGNTFFVDNMSCIT